MEVDYTDSRALDKFANENIALAEEYANSRQRYGKAVAFLNLTLAKRYQDGIIEKTISYEKALLSLVSNPACHQHYVSMIKEEQSFKGLEKVLEIRQAKVSLAQSLIKNTPK